MHGTAVKNIM